MYDVIVSNDVYKDTLIDQWMCSNVILESSHHVMKDIIMAPTVDVELLTYRQNAIHTPDISLQLKYLKELEPDVSYILSLDHTVDSSDNDFMSMLFPNDWYNSFINMTYPTIELYHLYRIYGIPVLQFVSPITILVGPYYYITKVLKIKLSMYDYISFIWKGLQTLLNGNNADIRTILTKWISFGFYSFLYVYGLWHVIDISHTLHRKRIDLVKKITNVRTFVSVCNILLTKIPKKCWYGFGSHSFYDETFNIEGSLSDVYNFWTNTYNYRKRLSMIIKCINYLDVSNTIGSLYRDKDWSKVVYTNKSDTKCIGMKNPLLPTSQTNNPVSLDKNMIVTGPNAGGKTTYVKTIVLNIILSQTIGISMCKYMITKPYSIISTFMRVNDEVGTRSYFETETLYCKNMIEQAKCNPDKNILFVMDEPMHSTPPIEGQSTAYAVCEYISSSYKNARLIVTTHFHSLIELENSYKDKFRNVSMEAIPNENDKFKFVFPYRIKSCYSTQCIALELLNREMFPKQLIDSAIKMKNRISMNICK